MKETTNVDQVRDVSRSTLTYQQSLQRERLFIRLESHGEVSTVWSIKAAALYFALVQ